ncbi:hypothetical protein RD792_001354, partial [Penstemon davidsonii]
MARSSLPPGFRFHPTDVELIMYYLKRKVMRKKLHFEAIAEVNIYKFSPWDLPDKSCLRSKDLEWFFFCPRELKYASGVRVKRATESGYWKTTGKERAIIYNDKSVGTVKTLVFHLGHAPKGERTDWVIHEYRILDEQLAAAGVQDTYVLCKVFKKNGLGPKNGAQYGAPFNEAEWTDDDDVDDAENNATPLTPNDPCLTSALVSENQTSVFDPGSTSVVSSIEEGPLPSTTTKLVLDEPDDEIVRLLASFTDEHTLFSNENENHKECVDGDDTYDGLEDLHRDGYPL